ncbi:MAG: transglutaminase domain-containing protein [Dehalococcoidales bacterium]|nr:transglutaminase domain-containing protein [Dehalococcoidales bacterium]
MRRKRRLLLGVYLVVVLGALCGLLAFFGAACLSGGGLSDDQTPEPAVSLSQPAQQRPQSVEYYVESADPLIRNTAVSTVQDCPAEIEANSAVWKIWQINRWVAVNIKYVSDPRGHNYFAYAHETINTGGGDCDDFAILLASLYESVGLDAAIASIDTDDDWIMDHMTCLVYYSGDGEAFIEEEKTILDVLGMSSDARILCFDPANSNLLPKKYSSGIWVVADPTMAIVKEKVGYVAHKPYQAVLVIDVGS